MNGIFKAGESHMDSDNQGMTTSSMGQSCCYSTSIYTESNTAVPVSYVNLTVYEQVSAKSLNYSINLLFPYPYITTTEPYQTLKGSAECSNTVLFLGNTTKSLPCSSTNSPVFSAIYAILIPQYAGTPTFQVNMTLGLPPKQTACSLQPDCGASAFSQQVNNFAGITPPGEGIKTEDHSGQIWIAGIGYQSPWAAVGMAVGCCAGLAIGLLLLQQRAIARQESLFGDDFENKTAVNINQTTENIAEEPVTMPSLIPLQELEEIVVQESTQKEDTALPQLNEAPEYELRSYDNLNFESREEANNLYSAVTVTSYCEQEQSEVSPPLEVTPLPSITPDVNEEALSLPLQQPTVSSTEPVAQDIPSAAPPKIDAEPIKSQDLERELVVASERSSLASERRPSHVKELKARFEANALELKAKKLEEYKPVPKAKIKVVVETKDILANTNQEVLEIQKPPTQSHVKPNDTILPHLVIPAIDVPVVEVAPIQPLAPEPSLKANIEGPPVEVVPSRSRRPSTKLEPIQEDKPLDFGRKVRHGRKAKSLYKQQLQQEFIKEYGYAVGKDTEGSNSSISSSGSNRSNNAKEESN